MENYVSLEKLSSDKNIQRMIDRLTQNGISMDVVEKIYSSFDEEGDYGIIKFDGEKISLKKECINDPIQLSSGLIVFAMKSVVGFVEEGDQSISNILEEFHIDRLGEIIGLKKVLTSCLSRKNCSNDIIELELNNLLVKLETVYIEIENLFKQISDHDKSLNIMKIRKTEETAAKEKHIRDLTVCYYESINLCIRTLCYLGEMNNARELAIESEKRLSQFDAFRIQKLKAWDKEWYLTGHSLEDKHKFWDQYISDEKKALNSVVENLKNDRIEITVKGEEK